MEQRNISITLEKAREWYNSSNETLKKIALQAFSKKELGVIDFINIKSFDNALAYLKEYKYNEQDRLKHVLNIIATVSKASAASFKLNIIKRVLNNAHVMYLTSNTDNKSAIWYPYFRLIENSCTYYNSQLVAEDMQLIGKIQTNGVIYKVLAGRTSQTSEYGLGSYNKYENICFNTPAVGFFGFASEEILKHFLKYFGMLAIESMYGDLDDFQII